MVHGRVATASSVPALFGALVAACSGGPGSNAPGSDASVAVDAGDPDDAGGGGGLDTSWRARMREGRATGVAVDGAGRVAVSGTVPWLGMEAGMVFALDAAGVERWPLAIDSEFDDEAVGIAADAAGNVYVAGVVTAAADLGGGVRPATRFVASYDSEGGFRWDVLLSWIRVDLRAIAVDPGGRVVVAGCWSGAVDFGGGERTSAGDDDLFVLVLDAGGGYVEDALYGTAGRECANAVAVAADGAIYVGGIAGNDALVVRFEDGAPAWQKTFAGSSGSGIEEVAGVAVDGAGAVVVAGRFTAGTDFGGGPRDAGFGPGDPFLARFDAVGAWQWDRVLSGGEGARLDAVAAQGDSIVAVGSFSGRLRLDDEVEAVSVLLAGADRVDGLVAAWDLDGASRWHAVVDEQDASGSADDALGAVAIADDGNVVFAGNTHSAGIPIVFAGGVRP